MLVFNFHLVFSFALLALALGAAILFWAKMHEMIGTKFVKFIAYIVIIASALNIVCLGFYGITYWYKGYFNKPYLIMMHVPMMPGLMIGGGSSGNDGGKSMPMMQMMKMMQNRMMSGQMQKQQPEQGQMMDNQMMNTQDMQKSSIPTSSTPQMMPMQNQSGQMPQQAKQMSGKMLPNKANATTTTTSN